MLSGKLLHNLDELTDSIRENSARVKRELFAEGVEVDPAIVASAAKYCRALDRLAEE